MEFGKWLWRLVVTIIVVFMCIAAYRIVGLLLKSKSVHLPVLAQVSLLDGTTLPLDQQSYDQDLITVSSPHEDLSMSWNGLPATSQLVIDPRKLPSTQQKAPLFKWLVAIPRESILNQKFCVRVPDQETTECYRFSRTPKQDQPSPVVSDKTHSAAEESPLVYPETLISIQEISDDLVSLFVTLRPYVEGTRNTVNQRKLFIRVSDPSTSLEITNGDQLRLNGYPFVQLFLKKGISVTVECIDLSSEQEYIYDVQLFSELVNGASPLKTSAPALPAPSSLPVLPSLNFHWLGSEKTQIDQSSHLALDRSDLGNDFSTVVTVTSEFSEPIKVVVQLLDVTTTFSHTIAPQESGEVLVNISNLNYGPHRLQLNAILPSGLRTADVIIPFEYRPAGWY